MTQSTAYEGEAVEQLCLSMLKTSIRSSLEYMNFFDAGANLTRNLAPGKTPAKIVGTPVVLNKAAQFLGSAACLETEVPDLPAATLIALVLFKQSPDMGFAIANHSDTDAGACLCLDRAAGVNMFRGRTAAGRQVAEGPGMRLPDWETTILLVGRYDRRRARIDNLTTRETTKEATQSPLAQAKGSFRIGGSRTAAKALIRVSYASIHSRWIMDAEMYEIAEQIERNCPAPILQ